MISCSGYCLFACKYPRFNRSIINKRWEGCNRSISKHAGDWTAHMSCMNKNYWDSCSRGHSPRVLCLSEFIIKWRNGLLVWSPPAEQTRVITADPCDHSCPYYIVCWQTVWLTPEEKKSMVIFTAPLPPLAKIRTLLEYGMHLRILHFQLVFFFKLHSSVFIDSVSWSRAAAYGNLSSLCRLCSLQWSGIALEWLLWLHLFSRQYTSLFELTANV